jgi:hypothetical protein
MSIKLALAAALLILTGAASAAPTESRVLEVPSSASWQHAGSGLVLPSRVAGLGRGPIADRTAEEQDVSAAYEGEEGLFTTVYIYQTPLPDVAIWTDRALAAIMLRPDFGADPAASPAPIPFQRPGASSANGLRVSLPLVAPGRTSTALAIAPIGDWLVKIRMTSTQLDPGALHSRLTTFIAGLRWPAEAKPLPAATAMSPCADSLALKKAKVVGSDMATALMGLVMSSEFAKAEGAEPIAVRYCREPGPLKTYGVYRPNGVRDSYVIAVGDSGSALRVASELTLDGLESGRAAKRVGMTLLERNSASSLPSFNRLPPPEQALEVAFGNRGESVSLTIEDPKK